MISVVVDTERCEGHGQCEEAAPAVFVLVDEGVATTLVNPVPENLIRQAEAGVRVCPVATIRIVTT